MKKENKMQKKPLAWLHGKISEIKISVAEIHIIIVGCGILIFAGILFLGELTRDQEDPYESIGARVLPIDTPFEFFGHTMTWEHDTILIDGNETIPFETWWQGLGWSIDGLLWEIEHPWYVFACPTIRNNEQHVIWVVKKRGNAPSALQYPISAYKKDMELVCQCAKEDIKNLEGLSPEKRKKLEENKKKLEDDPSNDSLREK